MSELTHQRLDELETKVAFQEELIDQLNAALIEQQGDIKRLTRLLSQLTNQLQDLRSDNLLDHTLEPPPHY